MLECWLLALGGEKDAHCEADPVKALHERHQIEPKRTTAMVQLVLKSRLLDIPDDANSFWRWLRRAAVGLNVKIPKQWPEI
jgi:hypothetical protein